MSNVNVPEAIELSDGSGVMLGSFPLPKDHWLYKEDLLEALPVISHRDRTLDLREKVHFAVKRALKACTNNGKDMDLDPDALINAISYDLVGPFGKAIETK